MSSAMEARDFIVATIPFTRPSALVPRKRRRLSVSITVASGMDDGGLDGRAGRWMDAVHHVAGGTRSRTV